MAEDRKENEMRISDKVDYLRGLNGLDSVLINPADLPYPYTGESYIRGDVGNRKWHRIAVRSVGSSPSSGVFNIGNDYNYEAPGNVLFHAFAECFNNGSVITKIASSTMPPISKARVVFDHSISLMSFLDIFVRLGGDNTLHISASSLIGFKLQSQKEVSASIPEGYNVKEVSF